MRKAALGLAVMIFLGASSACAAAGSSPTKGQYVALADQVCSASSDQLAADIQSFEKENPGIPDAGTTERYVRFVLIKHMRETIAQLRSIAPPEGDGAYLGSMYADYEHALGVLYQDTLGDSADSAGNAAEARLRRYGMKKCSTITEDARKKADKLETEAKKAKTVKG